MIRRRVILPVENQEWTAVFFVVGGVFINIQVSNWPTQWRMAFVANAVSLDSL